MNMKISYPAQKIGSVLYTLRTHSAPYRDAAVWVGPTGSANRP